MDSSTPWTVQGSEGSAAGGRESDLSEWQRSKFRERIASKKFWAPQQEAGPYRGVRFRWNAGGGVPYRGDDLSKTHVIARALCVRGDPSPFLVILSAAKDPIHRLLCTCNGVHRVTGRNRFRQAFLTIIIDIADPLCNNNSKVIKRV